MSYDSGLDNTKQKTVLMKVIDTIKGSQFYVDAEGKAKSYLDGLIQECESHLPEERQQIIDFHVACVDNGAIEEGETVTQQDKEWIKNHAEQYYNETYGHDKDRKRTSL